MSYRYKVASIFLLGFFIDCINIFMSAVALPSLSATLQVSSASVAWVANAYILGLTLIIALSTWLAARFGSREILTASMLVFSGSVWLCGQADSFHELVIWRFVQGIGGGLLIPVGQALTFNLFHGEQRAKISTLIMAVALIAPAMSPTVGGLIVDISSWRWVFYSTLPFSLLAAGLSWWWIREGKPAELQRPDIKGLLLVSAVLASLLMGMSLYGGDYPPLAALGFVIAGLTFIALYLLHYRRCSNAIIDLSLLRSRKLSTSIFIYYAIPGVFTGVNLMSIFFLQNTLHFSARLTGMFMILYAIGAFIAMILCGRVYNRIGARRLFTLGMLLHSAGIATLVLVNAPTDLWLIMIAYSLMGIGGGIGANTAQTTSLMDFTGGDTHKASVIWNINRQMSFSLGAALFLMIFNVLLPTLGTTPAYHATFAIAALVGLLPLLQMNQLPPAKERP
ncbi:MULTISPECIES: MFS transporter [Pseudomonas]|uniref:MFS transporter n=1 Tax=Pseudomonas TaxID=286 RepID=UPI00059B5E6C|nr:MULTISPECIES: MFS transporter [Pseudomonas]AMT90577.1 MFS transporter [Pseudomonas koreensis]MBB4055694.1 EmrB/QacA subfamily drug resistance transporter [Pseudomonas koreensis]TSB50140.1 multidrug efflux MFS transporter [Pseudomonas sp. ef1]UST78721.1 MFS transporter [Pseudomonas siliginis]UST94428.1 MFS transporter [Pseudomonas siliginis]